MFSDRFQVETHDIYEAITASKGEEPGTDTYFRGWCDCRFDEEIVSYSCGMTRTHLRAIKSFKRLTSLIEFTCLILIISGIDQDEFELYGRRLNCINYHVSLLPIGRKYVTRALPKWNIHTLTRQFIIGRLCGVEVPAPPDHKTAKA